MSENKKNNKEPLEPSSDPQDLHAGELDSTSMEEEIENLRYEFRNYKSTSEEEAKVFLKQLLSTLDTFDATVANIEEALAAEEEEGDRKAKKVLQRFQVLRKNFGSALIDFGVCSMEKTEECVAGMQDIVKLEYTTEVPEGHVLRVEKLGYWWKNQILRPAKVVVASAQQEDNCSNENEDQPNIID